jgi:DNA anti-recombination protein RmuC
MSQTYVIKVSASVKESVSAKDKRKKKLVLTGIVPEDEQKEILQDELKKRGWEEVEGSDGKKWRRERGDVTETIDLDDMSVEAEVSEEKTLERNRTIVVRGDRDFDDVEQRRRKEKKDLEESIAITEQEKEQAEKVMQREIAEKLDATEEERNKELNEVVRDVYAESLKRKAGRLGSVTEISEGQEGEDYELVIKITE